jgi:hypothetical protein
VLRLPPADGSCPVSASVSEIPKAFAFKATASPLNVVVPCAKLRDGLRAETTSRQIRSHLVHLMSSFGGST